MSLIDEQSPPNTNFEDAVDDVHTRFLLNLPESELQTADRIFFQIEQAWWFYEDFLGDPHPELNLPRYPSFKPFARMLFDYSPLLPDVGQFASMWEQFSNYKRKISNYGCILLTEDCQKILLCRVYNGASYMIPAGKINQGEDGRDAAARETYEETGFDPSCRHGLTKQWLENSKTSHKIAWKTEFSEQNMLVCHEDNGAGKRRTNYVVNGVPEDFPFEPVARKEVSSIEWFPLDNLPKATFGVLPFVHSLREWIRKQQKKHQSSSKNSTRDKSTGRSAKTGRDHSNSKSTRNNSRGRNSNGRGRRNDSRGSVVQEDDDLVEAGLASMGESSGWSEEEMFSTNERLIGRKIEYDGNPHVFAEEGLSNGDPHAFRIVGGTFLNSSGGIGSLAPPPERSLLQPLFLSGEQSNIVEGLTPFFSSDGATPWGEVVPDAKAETNSAREISATTAKKQRDVKSKQKTIQPTTCVEHPTKSHVDDMFLTDRQITQKSQSEKCSSLSFTASYDQSMALVRQWVENLPKPVPTKHFGLFRLDVAAIMAQARRDVPGLRKGTTTA